jgi:hypothetical protein
MGCPDHPCNAILEEALLVRGVFDGVEVDFLGDAVGRLVLGRV